MKEKKRTFENEQIEAGGNDNASGEQFGQTGGHLKSTHQCFQREKVHVAQEPCKSKCQIACFLSVEGSQKVAIKIEYY